MVGGAEESLHVVEGGMRIVVEKRKGFVREAITAGASLVPVLAYGENDVYHVSEIAPDSAAAAFAGFVKRLTGFVIPRFSGRTIFYKGGGMMPNRVPITCVVGRPIPPPPRPADAPPFAPLFDKADKSRPLNDDAQLLNAQHRAYIDALMELYQSTKNAPWNRPGLCRTESLELLK